MAPIRKGLEPHSGMENYDYKDVGEFVNLEGFVLQSKNNETENNKCSPQFTPLNFYPVKSSNHFTGGSEGAPEGIR